MLARFNAGLVLSFSLLVNILKLTLFFQLQGNDVQIVEPPEAFPRPTISLPSISTISSLPPPLPISIPTPVPAATAPPVKPKNTTKSDLSRLRAKMRELMGYVMKQTIPAGPDVDLLFCAWVDDTLSKVKESTPS